MYWSQVRILAGPPAFLIIQLGCATRWYTARIRLEIVFSYIFQDKLNFQLLSDNQYELSFGVYTSDLCSVSYTHLRAHET